MKMICGCEIAIAGITPDPTNCVGIPVVYGKCKHYQGLMYPCTKTGCRDYCPAKVPMSPTDWPRCVCGEVAQEHG